MAVLLAVALDVHLAGLLGGSTRGQEAVAERLGSFGIEVIEDFLVTGDSASETYLPVEIFVPCKVPHLGPGNGTATIAVCTPRRRP